MKRSAGAVTVDDVAAHAGVSIKTVSRVLNHEPNISEKTRAKVVEAEAEVPRAMASALREGKLGVMDYYKMQNVISDTRMRESIAETGANDAPVPGEGK